VEFLSDQSSQIGVLRYLRSPAATQGSVAEIRFGIERAPDAALRAELEAWVRDGLLPWFGERILEVSERILLRWRWLVWEGQKDNYTF
jgi:hypothetical protein